MPHLRATAFATILASTFFLTVASTTHAQRLTPAEMDPTQKPGDDFYLYANGGWLKSVTIPAGQSTFDDRAILTEKTTTRVRLLISEAAASKSAQGTNTQKVGDYFESFVDLNAIDAKGLAPLSDDLADIDAINTKASLSAYLGGTLNIEVDGLTSNADHVFGVWVNQGFHDSKMFLPHIWQGGLGLPDRDNYLDASPAMADQRAKYQAHIATILQLAQITTDDATAEKKAVAILALETQMARAQAPDSDALDVFKQDNPWKRVDFDAKAPGMDWNSYFQAAGLATQEDFIVWQPTAVTGTSALVASENLETWKDYLRFHLVEHYAPVLPKAIRLEDFGFYSTTLNGITLAPDREKIATTATNAALGQAVGQLYCAQYFPPEAKAAAQAMGVNLITAYRVRLANLTWMSPETKTKAIAKLDAFTLGLGYPDKWIDYDALDVVRGDAFGNLRRAEAFNRARNIAQMHEPADPAEWRIDPQTVGAIIVFTPNSEFFSAAILQPPYFDPQGDAASNYGSAGAGMAHEITHSFDELGNIYDAQGRIGMWWTAQDIAAYRAVTAKLVAQFSAYCPLAGLCLNGQQVLTENSADIAGLRVAYDAYILSLHGKPDAVIGGLTGDQRFFLAFAGRWRRLQTEAALRKQVKSDTHPPGQYRSDTVRNLDPWYVAFPSVAPAEKLYLKSADRVGIW
ncbi:MAG TPA: M13 family metallopeptidase [Candidatus Acidoferrales bacterium]